MQAIRWILGRLILLFDWIFTPKAVKRDAALQAKIDEQMSGLALYQYPACPFCVKVRRAIKRNNLNIKMVNVKTCEDSKKELEAGGGKLKVPCLRIEEPSGNITWMYESSDIINYLEGNVSNLNPA
jgi:glutaredoxin